MAKSTARQERLIGERARALATMILTTRDDLHIMENGSDLGLDLLVALHSKGKSGLRQFGVELRGTLSPVSLDHANKVLRPSLRQLRQHGPFPFPVCLFYFTMQEPRQWYTWVVEPIAKSDGSFELVMREDADFQPLDDESLDQIVQRVHGWFDAFYSEFAAHSPDSKK